MRCCRGWAPRRPDAADRTIALLREHGREAQRIGHAVADPEQKIFIPARGLIGRGKKFWKEERAARRTG